MPGVLAITPVGQGNVIPFGPVIASTTLNLSVLLTNIGNANVTFQAISLTLTPIVANAGDFMITSVLPTGVLAPGGNVEIKLAFRPTMATATAESTTLTIFSDASMSPTTYTLTGIAAQSTDVFLQATINVGLSQPSPCVAIFNNQVTGVQATSAPITLKNTSSNTITIVFTPLSANGYSVINGSGANPLTPAGSYTFNIALTPVKGNVGFQDDANAVTLNLPSASYPQTIEATYYIPPVVSAFATTDQSEVVLMGMFKLATQAVAVMSPNPASLACEEIASFTRQFDMSDPTSVKQLCRFLMRYERLGPTVVSITYATVSPTGQAPVTVTQTLNVSTDGQLMDQLFDGSIAAGSIVKVTVTVAANAGPLSVAVLTPYFEPRGENIEAT